MAASCPPTAPPSTQGHPSLRLKWPDEFSRYVHARPVIPPITLTWAPSGPTFPWVEFQIPREGSMPTHRRAALVALVSTVLALGPPGLAAHALGAPGPAASADVYVAPGGDDHADGSA